MSKNTKKIIKEMKDRCTNEIHLPNEIFSDLEKIKYKSKTHKYFALGIYYLSDIAYRNCLYGEGHKVFNQPVFTSMLTKSPDLYAYITKRNGKLDKAGLTYSTRNYPISYNFDEHNTLIFSKLDEFEKNRQLWKGTFDFPNNNFFIKKPVKSFYRYNLNEQEKGELTGTYYARNNTFTAKSNAVLNILADDELKNVALYLYIYLCMKCSFFPDGYSIKYENLAKETGVGMRSIKKYIPLLEKKGYIESVRRKGEVGSSKSLMDLNKIFSIK